jgi:hypothetical protein
MNDNVGRLPRVREFTGTGNRRVRRHRLICERSTEGCVAGQVDEPSSH